MILISNNRFTAIGDYTLYDKVRKNLYVSSIYKCIVLVLLGAINISSDKC